MKVLVVSLLPDGGGVVEGFRRMGYYPHTLEAGVRTFRQLNALTLSMQCANGAAFGQHAERMRFNLASFFMTHSKHVGPKMDSFVGPPAAAMFPDFWRAGCCDDDELKVVFILDPPAAVGLCVKEADEVARKIMSDRNSAGGSRIPGNSTMSAFYRLISTARHAGEVELDAEYVRGHHADDSAKTHPAAPPQPLGATSSAVRLTPTLCSASGTGPYVSVNEHQHADAEFAAGQREVQRMLAVVQAAVPSQRLLIWKHGDGYEPLVRFLDPPVRPLVDEPFPPFVSQTGVYARHALRIRRRAKVAFAVVIAGVWLLAFWSLSDVRRAMLVTSGLSEAETQAALTRLASDKGADAAISALRTWDPMGRLRAMADARTARVERIVRGGENIAASAEPRRSATATGYEGWLPEALLDKAVSPAVRIAAQRSSQ